MNFRPHLTPVGQDDCPDNLDASPSEFDDAPWEAFLPDEQIDPLPEPGDFWIERDQLDAQLLAA